ncbi:MAG TPA: Mur ligase family protein [Parachlamydiaceae bacterium]|nr:Mur ligase family protein [Parachlamydiaceae bacterium]
MKSDYSKLLSRLLKVNYMGGIKLGLKNCLELDLLLHNPSQAFSSVHVAGTNGKGSVSTKIAAACTASGLKVGLYTSPHISCFRERIRINGRMITEEQVQKHLSLLFSLCDQHGIKATFFELTTMMAFVHFAAEKVDVAVLETGLGGRLDATNISRSILSIITSISHDHTEILGDSIDAITKEKAGIIKASIPVIIGPSVPKSLIEPIAHAHSGQCIQVTGAFEDYHEENCAVARKALEWLNVKEDYIEEGLQALPPCRLETFTKDDLNKLGFSNPLPEAVILDVAHNPEGLTQLLKAVRKRYGDFPLRFVIGLSSNKDVQSCLSVVKDEGVAFHLIEGCNERAVPNVKLADDLRHLGLENERIVIEPSISAAITNAVALAGQNNELVIVCGTFFIMSQARQALGINESQDPTDMNER